MGDRGRVYGVEIVPELVQFGNNNLKPYFLDNAVIVQAEATLGLKSKAPFAKILVSASSPQVPQELLAQLEVGGVLVLSVKETIWQVHKASITQHSVNKYPGFRFVPLQK